MSPWATVMDQMGQAAARRNVIVHIAVGNGLQRQGNGNLVTEGKASVKMRMFEGKPRNMRAMLHLLIW